MEKSDLEIHQRAYALWEQDGRPSGTSLRHWLEAEREIQDARQSRQQAELDEGLVETFPASDPPASLMRTSKAA